MVSELTNVGRRTSNTALMWWSSIEKSTGTDLRKKKLYQASLFTDMARAFLSTQASPASAERLFSDSGIYEGSRRHHADSFVEEMLFIIRSFVMQHISERSSQKNVYKLESQICQRFGDRNSFQIIEIR